MMRRVLLALTVVAAGACTESTAPKLSPAVGVPRFGISSDPNSAAPLIVRSSGGDNFLLFNDDRSVDLVAVMRTPSAPVDLVPCGGLQQLDSAGLLMIFHNSGAINLHLKGSQVHVWLYERHAFIHALIASGGLCGPLETQSATYEGFADFTLHDNDTFASGVHTDSFGFSSHGTVSRISDGATFSYQNEYHGSVGTDGIAHHFSSNITLR